MEEVILHEQDLVNAICLFLAEKKELPPADVRVELMYDDEYGFSAEAYVKDRKQILVEAAMIEAVRYWLDRTQHIDPFAASLKLELDEQLGIIAHCVI